MQTRRGDKLDALNRSPGGSPRPEWPLMEHAAGYLGICAGIVDTGFSIAIIRRPTKRVRTRLLHNTYNLVSAPAPFFSSAS